MPRRSVSAWLAALLALVAVVACTSNIVYPGQLVGSFNTALIPRSNSCTDFSMLPGFCPENGSPGPCQDGGYPDGGSTVLVVSMEAGDAGYISYASGSQSATSDGTFDGQTVVTQAVAQRFFVLANQPSEDAGCFAQVTETISLTLYASLDGGCQGGIPSGPPPTQLGGVWQTQNSPACGLLVDVVVPYTDGGCAMPVPPECAVSFGLVGQGQSSVP